METRYELRTVKDFYDVPVEKRAACLEDFSSWLAMMEEFHQLLGDIEGIRSDRDVFRWIDDGKHDMNVSIGVINTRVSSSSDLCPRCGKDFESAGGKPSSGPLQCQRCAAEDFHAGKTTDADCAVDPADWDRAGRSDARPWIVFVF
jgi:ribosomal protein L37E